MFAPPPQHRVLITTYFVDTVSFSSKSGFLTSREGKYWGQMAVNGFFLWVSNSDYYLLFLMGIIQYWLMNYKSMLADSPTYFLTFYWLTWLHFNVHKISKDWRNICPGFHKIGTLLLIFKFLRIFYVISVLLLIHIVTTLIIIAMLYSVVRCIL